MAGLPAAAQAEGEAVYVRADAGRMPDAVHVLDAASSDSPRRAPRRWRAPKGWLVDALCIHRREGAWNAIGYVHGRPTYGGGLQFMVATWQSVGGAETSVYGIAQTSPREQLYRAWLVWRRDGGSWREWGTARACGLK